MATIKLFLCDIDGTLIRSDDTLSQKTIAAIMKAKRAGVHVILSSGRSGAAMSPFRGQLELLSPGNYASGLNGGTIFNGEKIIREIKFPLDSALTVISELKKIDGLNKFMRLYDSPSTCLIEADTGYNKMYTTRTGIATTTVPSFESALKKDINKILLIADEERLVHVSKIMTVKKPHSVNMFFSSKNLLEFTPTLATKGNSLKFFAEKLNVPYENIMAMGDSYNDISMLKLAGVSVSTANAEPEVQAYTSYVTKTTNDEDAVFEAIEKFIS